MPTYPLQCACGRQWDEFAHAKDRYSIRCTCGAEPEVRFTDLNVGTNIREWRGREAENISLPHFDPSIKKTCPSVEFGPRGNLVFKSDQHQRTVFKEIGAEMKRIKERRAAKREAKQRGKVETNHVLPKSLNTPAKGLTNG